MLSGDDASSVDLLALTIRRPRGSIDLGIAPMGRLYYLLAYVAVAVAASSCGVLPGAPAEAPEDVFARCLGLPAGSVSVVVGGDGVVRSIQIEHPGAQSPDPEETDRCAEAAGFRLDP